MSITSFSPPASLKSTSFLICTWSISGSFSTMGLLVTSSAAGSFTFKKMTQKNTANIRNRAICPPLPSSSLSSSSFQLLEKGGVDVDAQARFLRKRDHPVLDGHPVHDRVESVRKIAVEVGEDDVRAGAMDMSGRGQPQPGLDHAAEHAADVGGLSDEGDRGAVANTAGFHQLDVEVIAGRGVDELEGIGRRKEGFIGHDPDRALVPHLPHPGDVGVKARLFNDLDLQLLHRLA